MKTPPQKEIGSNCKLGNTFVNSSLTKYVSSYPNHHGRLIGIYLIAHDFQTKYHQLIFCHSFLRIRYFYFFFLFSV